MEEITILAGAYPPNIEEIKKAFKVADNTIYTYGNTIYSPKGADLDLALMAHEQTHAIQQGGASISGAIPILLQRGEGQEQAIQIP